jgi:hypothetical protein
MRFSILLLVVTAPLGAQSQLASPAFFATREGNAAHDMLGYRDEYRYQQSHGDLGSVALSIRSLALRRDGAGADHVTAVARTIDAEVLMCDGPGAAFSETFAANYASTPQVVMTRKLVALPDLRKPAGLPAPFAVAFAFDTPFAHGLGKDVLWELRMFGTSAIGPYQCDAYADADVYEVPGATYGSACTVSGKTVPVAISAAMRSDRVALLHSAELRVTNLPQIGWGVWILGASPASIQTGWCAPVAVSPDLSFLAGGTPGTFVLQLGSIPYDPKLVGVPLHAQAIVVDNLHGGAIVLSDAVAAALPALLPATQPIRRIYTPTTSTTTGFGLTTNGGVVVRFGI